MFAAPRAFTRRPNVKKRLKTSRGATAEPHAPRDPLELHFRKMTEFPLLTAQGELALARKLERADLAIARALLACAEGRAALGELANALRAGDRRVEEIERNPSEHLLERIERVIAEAELRPSRSRTRPRARGLRLHPRVIAEIERELAELARARSRRTALHTTLDALREARRVADGATAEFVQANLRIVVTFARRYRGMPLVDLIQEGNLGLLRAVDKYDHRRGLRFSTYAAWWIRHSLSRALADQSKMIRYPVHLTGSIQRVRRAQERFTRESGRDPSPAELAERTGIPIEQVRRALEVVAQPVSLDAPLSTTERDASELVELVTNRDAPGVDEEAASHELRDDARKLLEELSDRERQIIRMRYGIDGHAQRTLEEVGARLSLSRERARQIERDALRKLRVASEKRQLRAHLSG
jgi:RNA polymerase primary sigma factor